MSAISERNEHYATSCWFRPSVNLAAPTVRYNPLLSPSSNSHVGKASISIRARKLALLLPLVVVSLIFLYVYLPVGLDWRDFFRPAALAMLRGESPYAIAEFHNTPWTLIPLLPFAVMPYQVGRVGVFVLGLIMFSFIAYRLGAKPPALLIFLSSAAVVGCLNNGNIDWFPMLAFVLPPRWGLVFAVSKPQVGAGIALYWLYRAWVQGGVKQVVRTFLPVTILLALSFWMYGFWFINIIVYKVLQENLNNMSFFPYSLPLGIYLLYIAMKRMDARASFGAAPCLAPYVTQFSYAAVLAMFMQHPKAMLVISAALWVPVIVRILN